MKTKISSWIKTIWLWFVYSSKDPRKVSMTVKSIGGVIVTKALPILAVIGYNISGTDVTEFFNSTGEVVRVILEGVFWIGAAYGFLRKLFTNPIKDPNTI